MTKYLNKFKKKKFFFPQKICLSRTTPHGFQTPHWVSQPTNKLIPKKHPHRRTEGQKDGQNLIGRTDSGTTGGPNS